MRGDFAPKGKVAKWQNGKIVRKFVTFIENMYICICVVLEEDIMEQQGS